MLSVVLPLAVGLVGPLAGPLGGRPALVRPAAALALAPLGPVMQFGRSSRRSVEEPSEELVAAFRLLGISEDATYDQVESAYAELLERYKGQTKQTIKLQVAKDKILDYRLRQRMSGALRPDRKFGARPAEPWARKRATPPLAAACTFFCSASPPPRDSLASLGLTVHNTHPPVGHGVRPVRPTLSPPPPAPPASLPQVRTFDLRTRRSR